MNAQLIPYILAITAVVGMCWQIIQRYVIDRPNMQRQNRLNEKNTAFMESSTLQGLVKTLDDQYKNAIEQTRITQDEVKTLKETILNMQRKREAELAEKDKKLADLGRTNEEQAGEIATLKATSMEHTAQLDTLQVQLTDEQREKASLLRALADRDRQIDELTARINGNGKVAH